MATYKYECEYSEEKEEDMSEYGFSGKTLIVAIKKALTRHQEDNIYVSIKKREKNYTAKVIYCDEHHNFDLTNEIVVNLNFRQLMQICNNYSVGHRYGIN